MSEQLVPVAPAAGEVSEVARLPELSPQQSHQAVELIFRFFCSLRLTLVNLLCLFLAMIAGTFVNPANDSLANIERAFAGRTGLLWSYRTFELYDLFHSWWFTALLLSLALNLIACSLERLPRIYYLVRYPETRFDRVVGLRLKVSGVPTELSADAVAEELGKRRFRIRQSGADVFAEKGRYSRFGVWVVHLSLLLILGGGIFGRLTAFEGTVNVPQGGGQADAFVERRPDGSQFRHKLVDDDGAGFLVQCDDFRLKEFEPGRPKAFESDLRLFKKRPDGTPGMELAHKTIRVNEPLRYAGLTFYQASYQQLERTPRARITVIDKSSGTQQPFLVGPNQPIEAAEGLSYQVVDYQEDFSGLGPAVQVVRVEEPASPATGGGRRPQHTIEEPPGTPRAQDGKPSPNAKVTSFWVFNKKPDFDRDNRADRFAFKFDRITPFYATGLQIARDPSTPIVYVGCFALFAGIGIAFYTAHKRVWAHVANGKISLGGAAHRNLEGFSREFEEVCDALGVPRPAARKSAQAAA